MPLEAIAQRAATTKEVIKVVDPATPLPHNESDEPGDDGEPLQPLDDTFEATGPEKWASQYAPLHDREAWRALSLFPL